MNTEERQEKLKKAWNDLREAKADEHGMIEVGKKSILEVIQAGVDAATDAMLLRDELVAEGEEVERLSAELEGPEE